jgi:hypothetical protein
MAERRRFFHWELEFPEVWFQDDGSPNPEGGFDAVLGNPPWDKVKPNRKEFYSRYDILIRNYKGRALDARIEEIQEAHPDAAAAEADYRRRLEETTAFLTTQGQFPYMTGESIGRRLGGDIDLFKAFTERFWQLLQPGGRAGVLVPGGIYNVEGCTGIRHMLLEKAAIEAFYAFENRKKIFPIHGSFKFVCLVFQRDPEGTDDFSAAFMLRDAGLLGRDAVPAIILRRDEIERLSPSTLGFLEFRTEQDRRIAIQMYEAVGWHRIGDRVEGSWNIALSREFDMTNDSDLWHNDDGSLIMPEQVLGRGNAPPDPCELRQAMGRAGYLPLYEGKKIFQYTEWDDRRRVPVPCAPIDRWMPEAKARQRLLGNIRDSGQALPYQHRRIALRRIARNTDSRTLIAYVLPELTVTGHSMTVVNISDAANTNELVWSVCAFLNSFCVDWLARLRLTGINVDAFLVGALPSPSQSLDAQTADELACLARRATETANSDHESYLEARGQIDAQMSSKFGLSADDVRYVVESFLDRPRVPDWLDSLALAVARSMSNSGDDS